MRTPINQGFTMAELLVVVAIIGILGGVIVPAGFNAWRTQQVNAAVADLEGWLAGVQRSTDQNNVSCRVTINTGTLQPQAALATATAITPGTTTAATGVTCGTGDSVRLPGLGGGSFSVATSFAANQFYFTKRGAISTNNIGGLAKASGADSNLSIRISADGQLPTACLRLTGMLGLIRRGWNNASGSTATECTTWGAL